MIENAISFVISSLVYAFVTSLRELLEAALIIGIIYGYLSKIDRNDLKKDVNQGVLLAILCSFVMAIVFIIFFENLPGYEELFEGIVMLLAAAVLSWMILWMWKQSKGIKGELEKQIDISISEGQKRGIVLLVFFAVFRELAELIIFLYASFVEVSINVGFIEAIGSVSLGFTAGLVLSIILAYLLFRSTKGFNLKKFFKITSVILIIFAAGLLAHGIHEIFEFFEKSGSDLASLFIFQEMWNVNNIPILDDLLKGLFGWSYSVDDPRKFEKSVVGGILSGLFGWNDNPALIEVIAYIMYYVLIGIAYFYVKNKPEPVHAPSKAPTN